MTADVLLVDDDDVLRTATAQALTLAGLTVRSFARAEAVLAALVPDMDAAIVSDIRMPQMDGLQLLAAVRARDADLPVILVTGHGDVPMAVAALKDGAHDFLTKPFAVDHLVASVRRARDTRALVLENRRLRALAAEESSSPLIGEAPAIVRIRDMLPDLSRADVDVLVEGESGTGKELVATLLHRAGPRRARAFIAVDCAALPPDAAEAELFGHAADSVAHTRLSRTGQIARSGGGTLLLDGVEALSPTLQARLLRVVEEREVQPIGAERADAVNLRVIATSRRDLQAEVEAGRFRADLYHRLARTRLHLPPLRAREGDRLLLFAAFLGEAAETRAVPAWEMSDAVRRHLLSHDWPGNVRELRNFAYAAVLTPGDIDAAPGDGGDLRTRVATFEATLIADTLTATGGNVVRALDRLKVPRKTLYDKLARYGIDPARFRRG